MEHSKLYESLRSNATSEQCAAMDVLESRGLSFLAHFGTQNAVEILETMNVAYSRGCLYQFMAGAFGIVTGWWT